MMNKGKLSVSKGKLFFYLYIAMLAILSGSTFMMPFGIKTADKSMLLTYMSGALFWIGLIGTIVMAVLVTISKRRCKEFEESYQGSKKLGLICFFKNTEAFVFDIIMFVSFVGFVITAIWVGTTVWPFVFLPVFIFSFGMHCMLNGSNYIYIKQQGKESN